MKKFFSRVKKLFMCNCGVRVNAVIMALVPAVDYAGTVWPLLKDHLPGDIYSAGFVFMSLVNILMHIRIDPNMKEPENKP